MSVANPRSLELNKHHSDVSSQALIQVKPVSFAAEAQKELFEEITTFGDYSLVDEKDETVRRVLIDCGPRALGVRLLSNLKNYA